MKSSTSARRNRIDRLADPDGLQSPLIDEALERPRGDAEDPLDIAFPE